METALDRQQHAVLKRFAQQHALGGSFMVK
jgi:hypothetical protein